MWEEEDLLLLEEEDLLLPEEEDLLLPEEEEDLLLLLEEEVLLLLGEEDLEDLCLPREDLDDTFDFLVTTDDWIEPVLCCHGGQIDAV